MKTNASMTLYHKVLDITTRKYIWQKHIIEEVMWQGSKNASINEGYQKDNNVSIYIPKTNDLSDVIFDIGDIVVKGILNQEISSQQDLNGVGDVCNIVSINDYDYGNLQHIKIGAK